MGIYPWIVVALSAFDLMIVTVSYFQVRSRPPMDRRALCATVAALSGFAFQAVLFLEGAFLILQLTTIAALFGLCWHRHLGRRSGHQEEVAE